MSAHANGQRARQAGFSLLELIVASLLASTFALAVSSASTVFFKLLNDLRVRTEETRAVNVIRGRMIADVKASSEAVCSDGETLLLTMDSGGAPSQVEYSASGGKLLRWYSVPDRTLTLAERVTALSCTALGERGVEIELGLGEETDPSHLYIHLSEEPPEETGT